MFNIRKMAANISVYAGLLTTGDIICQQLELRSERRKAQLAKLPTDTEELSWNKKRTSVFMYAGVPLGTLCHFWYTYIDRRLPGKLMKTVVLKVAADQLVFTPFFYLAFFTVCGSLEGKNLRECWQEIKQKGLIVYGSDLVFWPPIQMFNFYFISPTYRVAFVSSATVGWNIYLSFAKTSQLSMAKIKAFIDERRKKEPAATKEL